MMNEEGSPSSNSSFIIHHLCESVVEIRHEKPTTYGRDQGRAHKIGSVSPVFSLSVFFNY
jgi:hypothetical protein